MNSYIEKNEAGLVHTYNRAPVVIDRGEGAYLYDIEGKRYLDFVGGIAVCGLGYGNRELNDALKAQIDKLTHTSNLYYNTTCGDAAEALRRVSGMDRVFFTNSGTEAIEGAMKSARKYAWKLGTGRYEFIAFENSFHGRSIGATSVTGTEKFRTPFEPLLPGVRFNEVQRPGQREGAGERQNPGHPGGSIQGEGGIWPATPAPAGPADLCDEAGILLIFDEIQCGMGRTGDYFAWQGYGVKPDMMTMAKGIGSGIPVGAFAMTEAVAAHSLRPATTAAPTAATPWPARA